MKIKKLGLLSFGKFNNYELELNDGLNLIIGNNESGKSTIFSFIEGILYGFSKNNLKSRLVNSKYSKYNPEAFSEYRGYMEIEVEDCYRIERDFLNHSINFINLTTGEDLSNLDILYKYSRIPQAGVYIFGVNSEVFTNSFYIGQLSTKIDNLVSINEKLNELYCSNLEIYNSKKAIDLLNSKIEEIGRKTKTKSVLGNLYITLNELEEKRMSLISESLDYKILLNRKLELEKEFEELTNIKNSINLYKEQIIYNEVLALEEELNNIKKEESASNYNDLKRAIEYDENIKILKRQKDEIVNSNLNLNNIISKFDINEFNEIREDKEKILKFLNSLNKNDLDVLLTDINETKKIKNFYIIKLLFTSILIMVLSIFGIKYKFYYLFIIVLILLVYLYLRFIKYRVSKNVISRLNDRVCTKANSNTFEENNELFNKYGKDNLNDLLSYLDEKLIILKDKYSYIARIKEEININQNKLKTIEEKIENIQSHLSTILTKHGIKNIDEIEKIIINNNYTREKLIKEQIKNLLKGRNSEEFNHNLKIENFDEAKILNKYSELKISLFELNNKIMYEEKKKNSLINILEEITRTKKEINKFENEINAINNAINIIRDISNKNRKDITLVLKESIEYYMSKITKGKYDRIILDKEFNMQVFDKDINTFLDLSKLSNGTIEQLYISLRLSIFKKIFKYAPVILDDHFIQYDDNRLKEVIKFICEEFSDRQIIIFSATTREKNIIENLNFDYKVVKLN